MKQLIKALKIADTIQKPIKDQKGRYIYYDGTRFIGSRDDCQIEIMAELSLPTGYYNIKELVTVLSFNYDIETDVDYVADIRADLEWAADINLMRLTDSPADLHQAIVNVLTAYDKKASQHELAKNLIFIKNSVICVNPYFMLEAWLPAHNDSLLTIKIDAIEILKKCNDVQSIDFNQKHIQFSFAEYAIKFKLNDAITMDMVNRACALIESTNGYTQELSSTAITEMMTKCKFHKSKGETVINLNDYLNSTENLTCFFNIDYVLKLIPFMQWIHYDYESHKLYFAKNNIRGVLIGMRE